MRACLKLFASYNAGNETKALTGQRSAISLATVLWLPSFAPTVDVTLNDAKFRATLCCVYRGGPSNFWVRSDLLDLCSYVQRLCWVLYLTIRYQQGKRKIGLFPSFTIASASELFIRKPLIFGTFIFRAIETYVSILSNKRKKTDTSVNHCGPFEDWQENMNNQNSQVE